LNLVNLQPPRIESQKEDPVGFVTLYIWLFVVLYVNVEGAKQVMKLREFYDKKREEGNALE
jgi:hypothetical protein